MIKPLHIKIDARSPVPIYEQVKLAVKQAVFSGRLREGDQLTSIRDLSAQLKINPNTIIKVYSQLEQEGFIASRQGSGYYVKLEATRVRKQRAEAFEELSEDYLHKALSLGYTMDAILKLLQKKCPAPGPHEKRKEPPYASD